MTISDKEIIKKRFAVSKNSYNSQAVVQKQIVGKMLNILLKFNIVNFDKVLEIGYGTGFLTKKIINNCSVKEYVCNDIVDTSHNDVQTQFELSNVLNNDFIHGDAEHVMFPNNFDAIISSSTFQWFNNFESFISKIHDLLNDSGILFFSTFGERNFFEVKSIINVGLNYKTFSEVKQILSANYNIIHSEEYFVVKQFLTPIDVLKHMKATGVNGLQKSYFGKTKINQFIETYNENFSNCDDSVNLTYHPMIFLVKK